MLLEIHPDNPSPRHIKQVIDVLNADGVIIFPTDTIYGIGCDIKNVKAFEKWLMTFIRQLLRGF